MYISFTFFFLYDLFYLFCNLTHISYTIAHFKTLGLTMGAKLLDNRNSIVLSSFQKIIL